MDEQFMRLALELAAEAGREGEVPVGAVVTLGDRIVGRGRNRRETDRNALRHAELEAIDEACRTLGGWRLWQCTLYVTLEPCPMCAGAAYWTPIGRIVYGATDQKHSDIDRKPLYHPRTRVTGGVLETACMEPLKRFFACKRKQQEK